MWKSNWIRYPITILVPECPGELVAETRILVPDPKLAESILASRDSIIIPLSGDPFEAGAGGGPFEAGGAPLEAGGAPLEAGGAPLDAGGAPLEAGGAPLGAGGVPFWAAGVPVEGASEALWTRVITTPLL